LRAKDAVWDWPQPRRCGAFDAPVGYNFEIALPVLGAEDLAEIAGVSVGELLKRLFGIRWQLGEDKQVRLGF
jgi:hypothetical protein